jgi:CDP-4-dehydro-6-deoxyglucose reductase/ferredoxin-NAD(P)+ reductase (naphthalene dioxygenase ferredoxin-specific)
MSYKISLKMTDAAPRGIENPMGRTILESVLAAGLDYPHGCRAGNCGACKSHLISGEVEMSPYSEFALSGEEKARGLILACRAVPWSDCEIGPVAVEDAAVHASRRLECRVAKIEAATHDIRVLTLDILEGGRLDYTAGQYAELTFDGLPARDFSLGSAPGDDHLEFHIRHVAGGSVTTHIMDKLSVGDLVQVRGPIGTAHYRAGHGGPNLLLAGGSGLAPIKAITEAALDGGQDMFVYFGARDERDVYLENYFQDLAERHDNFNFTVVLSEPDRPTERRTGFLADAVAADFTDLSGFKAYLAGPPVMVESCTGALTGLGLARRDCHADAFYTQAEKINP